MNVLYDILGYISLIGIYCFFCFIINRLIFNKVRFRYKLQLPDGIHKKDATIYKIETYNDYHTNDYYKISKYELCWKKSFKYWIFFTFFSPIPISLIEFNYKYIDCYKFYKINNKEFTYDELVEKIQKSDEEKYQKKLTNILDLEEKETYLSKLNEKFNKNFGI